MAVPATAQTVDDELFGPVPKRLTGTAPYVQASSVGEAEKILTYLKERRLGKSAELPKGVVVSYGPCKLKPGKTYLRTSGKKKDVGFKPKTTCTKRVTSIKHESQLRYKWLVWWRDAGNPFHGQNSLEYSYEQKTIKYRCKGKKSTAWGGSTLGTVVYNGKTYYARVYPTINKLKCKV